MKMNNYLKRRKNAFNFPSILITIIAFIFIGVQPLMATKIKIVKVIDKDYILVVFQDGEVFFNDTGNGSHPYEGHEIDLETDYAVYYGSALNINNAININNWTIKSSNDSNYGGSGLKPVSINRKTKINGMAVVDWVGSDYQYDYTHDHFMYIKLPNSMQQGKTYTIEINANTNTDDTSETFTYDIFNSRSEAVHVNIVGYLTENSVKAADLYLWMGDGGARDYSGFEGNKVYLYNVNTQNSQEVGSVAFWKANGDPDTFGRNMIRSNVWSADFTGFTAPGTYRVAIEGVGCSEDFEIKSDVYHDPFMVSVQGFYYMRIGEDNFDIEPVPRRPLMIHGQSPSNLRIVITDIHPGHPDWGTFSVGDPWDRPYDFAAYSTGRENPNARGGHSDALDWDRHLAHVSIIYDMLLPYILTQGALNDDDLDIAESGNGIPDLLEEAQNEVDLWLSIRDGDGYGHGLTNAGDDGIMYQGGANALAAWANAANCAMLAECFRLAGQTSLKDFYQAEAIKAYNHAQSSPGQLLDLEQNLGESFMRGRDFKMMAAAYLYNLTGNTMWEDVVNAESVVNSTTSVINNKTNFDQLWATAGYLATPQTVHYPTLYNNMKASVIHQAKQKEANYINSRPSRRGTDENTTYFQTIQNMHRTMVAHFISDSQADKELFLNAMILEADWGLGRNPLNIIQMTTATTPLESKKSIENCYTSGRDDGSPGLHPGHTPYLNMDGWSCTLTMGCPPRLGEQGYPAFSEWPFGEAYFNTRWVWAHGEFTPQQTMRGKMALYGYLYGMGATVDPPTNYDLNTNGSNGSVSPNGGSYPENTTVSLSATPDFGYSFSHWSGDANGSGNPVSIVMDGNKSVTANFVACSECVSCGEVTNPGFENGLNNWLNNGNSSITSDAHSGGNALKTGSGQGGVHYGSLIDVGSSTDYSFTFWGKVSNSPSWAGVGLDFLDASDVKISNDVNSSFTNNYSAYTLSGVLPAGTEKIRIWTWKNGSVGNLFIDDFCLELSGQQTFDLTVNNGNGDGSFEEGETVSISANMAPPGQQFLAWTGDISHLADANSATTTVTMPASNITVTATYADIPAGATITVRARMINGSSDDLQLRLNDNTVHTWTISGTSFADYTYSVNGSNNIKLYFPDNGTDMRIDYINVDGTTYQAEDQAVNTSVWENGSCGGDFSEIMHCKGYIDFGTIDVVPPSKVITINAEGSCGAETMSLLIDGQTMETWNNLSSSASNYTYNDYNGGIIQVAFINDGNDGCDRNMKVDFIKIDNTTYQTENSATRTGCGNTEWLWCNGNFNFGDLGNSNSRLAAGLIQTTDMNKDQADYQVYPIPATSEINILLPGNLSSGLRIFDLRGSEVLKLENITSESKIDISHLKNGIYFIRLSEYPQVKKLLIAND